MRTSYIALAAVSIDGRIAPTRRVRRRWTSPADWRWFQGQLSRCEAVVVGRTTYRLQRARLVRRNTIVLTSRVRRIRHRGSVTFLNPKGVSLARYVRQCGYRRVAVAGGAHVYAYCFAHNIVSEFWITLEPVVFLAGTPLTQWQTSRRVRLHLKVVRRLNERGTLLLGYTL